MSRSIELDGEGTREDLERALEGIEHSEARYHVRQAIQLLEADRVEY